MISINTYNHIQRQFIRQENLSSKLKTSFTLQYGQKYFILPAKGKRFLKGQEKFIQWLINQGIKYETIFAQQQTIADDIGIHVRHLRKIIKKLKADGWLTVIETTGLCNIYVLHPIFSDRAFCIGMNYVFENLLVDKDMYRMMNESKYVHNELNKKGDIREIQSHQYQDTIYEDERFVPKETDRAALDEIFGQPVSNKIIQKSDSLKMPSIYNNEYTSKNYINFSINFNKIISKNNITKLLINKLSKNINNNNSQKGKPMQDLYSTDIISYWRQLKSIKPTLWGQLYLSAFPEEIVLHADKVTLNCKKNLATNLDRWKYLLSVCKGYSKDNDVEPDWLGVFNEAKNMGMPQNAVFFDDTFTPVKEMAPQKASRSKSDINPYLHNQAILEEYGPHLKENYSKPMTILEEYEYVKANKENNPEALAHWDRNARAFREQMGLTEEGTFLPGRSPHEAMKILFDKLM